MANIVNIKLSVFDNKWTFAVVRDDTYAEVSTEEVEPIKEHIDALVDFAKSVQTEGQIALLKAEEQRQEMLEVLYSSLTDEQKLEKIDIFPDWEDYEDGAELIVDKNVKYLGRLYKITQTHNKQSDWMPGMAVSLFTEVLPPGTISEFKQPEGAHDAYNINDKVIFEGYIYVSIIDNNVHSPEAYPQGWEREGKS